MARPRKPLEQQTGHRTVEEQERRKLEEENAKTERDDLEFNKVPSAHFYNTIARNEYKRTLKDLKQMEMVGNLDRANLIVYANAYGRYVEATKNLKKKQGEGGGLIIQTEYSRVPNPLIKIAENAYKELKSAGSALGMTIDARLKMAAAKINDEESEIEDIFGDI